MPPTFGEAKNSWLTGTAAWTFFNVSQYILGIQPTLDGLKVDPCIPHTLGGFTVTRRYRGATYHIAVDNTAAVQYGVKSVAVDGKPIEGSLLPLAPEGAVVGTSTELPRLEPESNASANSAISAYFIFVREPCRSER